MSYGPRKRITGAEYRGQLRQQRMQDAAAKHRLVTETKRGRETKQPSAMARLLARFRRRGR